MLSVLSYSVADAFNDSSPLGRAPRSCLPCFEISNRSEVLLRHRVDVLWVCFWGMGVLGFSVLGRDRVKSAWIPDSFVTGVCSGVLDSAASGCEEGLR